MDLDAAGGAITAGTVSGAIEKPTGKAGEHHHVCSDCGAEVSGRFCSSCGQPAHVHRTLLHLGEEILHGVMHFDSRVWRTLPLLFFRPGRLTREWVHGKRTRYVSPLAMFLFTVFVMFMLLSFMPVSELPGVSERLEEARVEQAAAQARADRAEAGLKAAAEPRAQAQAAAEVDRARAAFAEAEEDVAVLVETARVTGAERYDWKSGVAERARNGELQLNLGDKKLEEKIRHKLENPELALYKLQQTFYKFSFLLVPLSLPFVALLFLWKRGFTLYDHGVFVLYSLTFMSMLIMATAAATRIGGMTAVLAYTVLPFIVPAHFYYQLKGAYGLSWFSAAWRTFMLLVFCNVALVLFLLAILWLGLG